MSGVTKAVITAAGRGTRHFPATRTVQKELFPLVDQDGVTKPVLQIVAEEALESGIERICIVCSPQSEAPIRNHFAPVGPSLRDSFASKPEILKQAEHLDRLSEAIEIVLQPTPEGYGDAVLCAREFVDSEPFLLMLGDHLYLSSTEERCASVLLNIYQKHPGPISGVTPTPADQLHLFGTVSGDLLEDSPPVYRVEEMVEKPDLETARQRLRTPGLPEDEYLTFFGMHVLPARIFELLAERKAMDLRENGEIQLTSSLAALVESENYYAVSVPGRRLDMGVPEGLIQTQTALALHSPFRKTVLEETVRS